jgi:hypothetical protein
MRPHINLQEGWSSCKHNLKTTALTHHSKRNIVHTIYNAGIKYMLINLLKVSVDKTYM